MPTRTKRSALTAVLSASTLLLSGLAAAPQAGAATLYACVKKKGGTARFVSARTNCRRGETKLSWNTQGVPGRNGSNGKNGAAGKNGTNGKNGADGKAGANGKDGINGANGASTGIVDFSDSPFELPLTRHAVATLTGIPSGNYIVMAKVLVKDINPTEGVTVHCYIVGDEAATELSANGGYGSLSLSGILVSPLTSSITLECNDFGTSGIEVAFARIVAIQVQTLGGTTS
jgi:hypothetical protein